MIRMQGHMHSADDWTPRALLDTPVDAAMDRLSAGT